jgi:hypothetical protein
VSDDKESEREFYEFLRARRRERSQRMISDEKRAQISQRMRAYWANRKAMETLAFERFVTSNLERFMEETKKRIREHAPDIRVVYVDGSYFLGEMKLFRMHGDSPQ